MAHPVCFCPSLPHSGTTAPLQQDVSTPVLISHVYVQTLVLLATAMTAGM